MKENEMKMIAGFISDVLENIDDESVKKNISEKVRELNKGFQIYNIE